MITPVGCPRRHSSWTFPENQLPNNWSHWRSELSIALDAYILVNDVCLNQIVKIDRSGHRGFRGSYAAHMEHMEALFSSLNGDVQMEIMK